MRLSPSLLIACLFAVSPALAAAQRCDPATPLPQGEWAAYETYIRQNYAYLDRVDNADALLSRARARAANARTVGELGSVIERMGYAFRDSHFHVEPVAEPVRAWVPTAADLWLEMDAQGQFIVADVKQPSAAHAAGVRPGWIVGTIDGAPVTTMIAALFAGFVETPTTNQQAYAANVLAGGFLGQARRVSFTTPNGPVTLDLPAGLSSARRPTEPFTIRRSGDVAIIRFNNQLGNNDAITAFDTAMGAQANARAIILDLRDTPSGGKTTILRGIVGHFITAPRPYQQHRNIHEEVMYGVPRQHVELVLPRAPHYAGRVIVLAGRWTGSVGEAVAIAMDSAADAPSVGAPMAGLLGDLHSSSPGQSCLSISLAWDRLSHVDGTPREDWQPRTTLPSADSDADGGDPALARALADLAADGIATQ